MNQQYSHSDVKISSTLTRLQKWIAQVILITVVLTFATFIITFGYFEGWFVRWESLGKPPERPTRLIAITDGLWVETALGHVYQYESLQCGDKCWTLSDYPKPDTRPNWPLCGWLPPSPLFSIDTKVLSGPWGPGCYLTVYAIRIDGNVFRWEHRVGEGGSFWAYYLTVFYLAPLCLFVALIIVAGRNRVPRTGQGEFNPWKHQ